MIKNKLRRCLIWLFLVIIVPTTHAATISIKDYGASGNNQNYHTAIQAAIDACSTSGGGTVLFPAGDYITGSLELKSNVSLYFEAGSVLKASRNSDDYTKWALFYGKNLENVFILGPGMIDGQA